MTIICSTNGRSIATFDVIEAPPVGISAGQLTVRRSKRGTSKPRPDAQRKRCDHIDYRLGLSIMPEGDLSGFSTRTRRGGVVVIRPTETAL